MEMTQPDGADGGGPSRKHEDLDSGGGSPLGDDGLYEAAAGLVDQSRIAIARHANTVLVAANWRLGHLIDTETLLRGRGEYGQQILATLSQRLTDRFGRGFDKSNLSRMVTFSREWPPEILATLSQELSCFVLLRRYRVLTEAPNARVVAGTRSGFSTLTHVPRSHLG